MSLSWILMIQLIEINDLMIFWWLSVTVIDFLLTVPQGLQVIEALVCMKEMGSCKSGSTQKAFLA